MMYNGTLAGAWRSATCNILPAVAPQLSRQTVQRRVICTATASSLEDVLLSAGLAPYQVERVTREVRRLRSQNNCQHSAEWISLRLETLQQALPPDTRLAELVYNGGAELLSQDVDNFSAQLQSLTAALPGVSVAEILSKEPRLLWTPNLDVLLPLILTKLVAIYPYMSKDKRAEVLKMVEEYPELLVRMQFYCEGDAGARVTCVQDLPVDLQNRILRNYC